MSPYQNAACNTLPALDNQSVRQPCQTKKIWVGLLYKRVKIS
uniref:Uncharacterized protein n=1 Tax=Arundo donax TaxID=35708 RepID=A0A0A9HXF2_ARUDO